MRSCSPGATTAPDSILSNTSSYPREELAELWADVGSHLFRVEVLARSAFRHQPQTFSNSRSTRSPQTPSFERGAARETCVFSYAPACFSACAGTPQTIRSGGVVR